MLARTSLISKRQAAPRHRKLNTILLTIRNSTTNASETPTHLLQARHSLLQQLQLLVWLARIWLFSDSAPKRKRTRKATTAPANQSSKALGTAFSTQPRRPCRIAAPAFGGRQTLAIWETLCIPLESRWEKWQMDPLQRTLFATDSQIWNRWFFASLPSSGSSNWKKLCLWTCFVWLHTNDLSR